MKMTKIQKILFENKDENYAKFQAKLNPETDSGTIIGVRVPRLRALAKEFSSAREEYKVEEFLSSVPHKYFEENFIHSFLIETVRDYGECMGLFEKFLPYIDNWAVCDTCHPKVFRKHKEEVLAKAKTWIKSNETYTVRYGIDVFMTYFLDDDFNAEHLDLVAEVASDEYYVNMMQAWYYATALAKQWDAAVKIIEEKKLSPWVHNKTIQKARESFRVSDEHKEILLAMKVQVKK